jgi:hypothetical protein
MKGIKLSLVLFIRLCVVVNSCILCSPFWNLHPFRFHVLLDFDEDKRSCRRKLERHNKRRRRKPDSKVPFEKEMNGHLDLSADISGDDEHREGRCHTLSIFQLKK